MLYIRINEEVPLNFQECLQHRFIFDAPSHDEYDDITMEFFLTPTKWLAFSHYWRYDGDERETRAMWDSLTLTPNEHVSYWVSYSQFKDDHIGDNRERFAELGMDVKLSEKYLMELKQRYDLEKSVTRENRVSFIRDLHDWEAALCLRDRRRLYRDRELQVTFAMHFKFPGKDIPAFPLVSPY